MTPELAGNTGWDGMGSIAMGWDGTGSVAMGWDGIFILQNCVSTPRNSDNTTLGGHCDQITIRAILEQILVNM